ncbi:MAG: hypothetical protein ACRDFS_09620 [Chloroflexota bacterium]
MTPATYTAEFASGCRATLVIDPGTAMNVEWTPGPPVHLRGQKRRHFLAAYRAWRNDCLADYARRTGLRIAVVEM